MDILSLMIYCRVSHLVCRMAAAGPRRRRLRLTHQLHAGKHFVRELFCDGQLTKDGATTIPIHRIILAAVSTRFKSMFEQKDNQTPYVVPVVDLATLARVVDFIYEGAVEFHREEEYEEFVDALAILKVDIVGSVVEVEEREAAAEVLEVSEEVASSLGSEAGASREGSPGPQGVAGASSMGSRGPQGMAGRLLGLTREEVGEASKPTILPNGSSRPRTPLGSAFTKPCIFFKTGGCMKDNCTFLHVDLHMDIRERRERSRDYMEDSDSHIIYLVDPSGSTVKTVDIEQHFTAYGVVKRVSYLGRSNMGSKFKVVVRARARGEQGRKGLELGAHRIRGARVEVEDHRRPGRGRAGFQGGSTGGSGGSREEGRAREGRVRVRGATDSQRREAREGGHWSRGKRQSSEERRDRPEKKRQKSEDRGETPLEKLEEKMQRPKEVGQRFDRKWMSRVWSAGEETSPGDHPTAGFIRKIAGWAIRQQGGCLMLVGLGIAQF